MKLEEIELKIKRYKQEFEKLSREEAVNEGKAEGIIKELEKHGISTVEQAQKKLKELDKEMEQIEKELIKDMEKLDKEYASRLS